MMQKVNTPAATEGRVPNNPVVIVDYKPALAGNNLKLPPSKRT